MDVWFFKLSFPFHRLVGSCLNNDLSQLSTTTVSAQLCHLFIPRTLPGFIVLFRGHHHTAFEREYVFATLVVGDGFNCDDTTIRLTAGELFIQYLRFRVNRVAMKSRAEVLDVLKFQIGNGFSAYIGNAHAERDAENERAYDKTPLELSGLGIVSIDMQRIMIHGEHAEKRVVVFGNSTAWPVLVDGTNFKFFETSAKLHICLPFAITIYISPTTGGRSPGAGSRWFPRRRA